MKLILIYGPPASGKLTIARELSKLTNFKLVHNHLTVDLISSILSSSDKDFWHYVNKLRYDLLSLLFAKNFNAIFTMVFDSRHPDNFKNITKFVENKNGKIFFVQLKPHKEILLKRVKGESRKRYGKLTSVKELGDSFKIFDTYGKFSHKNHLEIDNSNISPKRAALIIKKYFTLK